jgi:acetyl/propionyl-CoA carboxylase alpha subunit
MHYEPLMAKVMAWGKDRSVAIKRLQRALLSFRLEGVKSNIPLLWDILNDQGFKEAIHHTGSLSVVVEARNQEQDDQLKKRQIAAVVGVALAAAMQGNHPKNVSEQNPWLRQARLGGVKIFERR